MLLAQGFERAPWITKRLDTGSLKKSWSWEEGRLTIHEGDTMSPWCCPLRMSGQKGCQNDWTQTEEIPAGSILEGYSVQAQGSSVGFT